MVDRRHTEDDIRAKIAELEAQLGIQPKPKGRPRKPKPEPPAPKPLLTPEEKIARAKESKKRHEERARLGHKIVLLAQTEKQKDSLTLLLETVHPERALNTKEMESVIDAFLTDVEQRLSKSDRYLDPEE